LLLVIFLELHIYTPTTLPYDSAPGQTRFDGSLGCLISWKGIKTHMKLSEMGQLIEDIGNRIGELVHG